MGGRFTWVLLPAMLALGTSVAQPLADARLAALAGAGTALSYEATGLMNPAGRASVPGATLLAGFSRLYGLSELTTLRTSVAVPLGGVVLGASADRFGFEDYREHEIAAGIASRMPRFSRVYVGVDLKWKTVSISEYGSATAASVSPGIRLNLTESVDVGAAWSNLLRTSFDQGMQPVSEYRLGIAWSAPDRAVILADVNRIEGQRPTAHFGVELGPVSVLTFRAGLSTSPLIYSTGVGIRLGTFRADLAVQHHPILGLTPAATIQVGR